MKHLYKIIIRIIMTAVLKKVACNPTNSAAIDNEGNLYLWGTTKYGLCIDPELTKKVTPDGEEEEKTVKVISTPIKAFLMAEDEVKMLQDCNFSVLNLLDPDLSRKEQVYCASHISLGTYHGAVVVDDICTNYPLEIISTEQNDIL